MTERGRDFWIVAAVLTASPLVWLYYDNLELATKIREA